VVLKKWIFIIIDIIEFKFSISCRKRGAGRVLSVSPFLTKMTPKIASKERAQETRNKMANFTSVTLGNGGVTVSKDSPAGSQSQGQRDQDMRNQAMVNDYATHQPQNMKITLGGNGAAFENILPQAVSAPTHSGLPGSLSTIQNSYGFPVGDLTKLEPSKDTIQVGGSRCTIDTAVNQGLLQRDGSGNLIESDMLRNLNSRHLNKSTPNTEQVVDLVPDHRETLTQLHQRAGTTQTSAFVSRAVHDTLSGKSLDHLVADFSQTVNARADTVQGWISEYMQSLSDTGIDQAAKLGRVDRDQLLSFVETLDSGVQARLLMAVHYGDISAVQHLIGLFKERSYTKAKGK
jgi:hypothetical protein